MPEKFHTFFFQNEEPKTELLNISVWQRNYSLSSFEIIFEREDFLKLRIHKPFTFGWMLISSKCRNIDLIAEPHKG